jgi:hypothetical protein
VIRGDIQHYDDLLTMPGDELDAFGLGSPHDLTETLPRLPGAAI